MLLKSMMLASVRPFYAAAGDPPAGGDTGDQGNQGDQGGDTGDQSAGGDQGGDTGDQGNVSDQAAADAAKATADAAAAAAAAAPPAETWQDKEIRRKHAQLQEEKRRRAEVEAENETLRAIAARTPKNGADGGTSGDQGGGTGGEQRPASLSRDEVQAEAQRIVAVQNFDTAANNADAAGRTRYKAEWDTVTDRLKTLGGFDGPTMTAILATDDPAQVLYALGSKPEEYQRIMDLPDARRQNELVKLGLPPAKKTTVPSGAPAPVEGIHSRPRADTDSLDDKLDDDTWYARRARQKAARWEAKRQQQNRA